MKSEFKTVSIIGLGYIGLPTAALIASRNIRVIGIDSNPEVVATIDQGRVHIVELIWMGWSKKSSGTVFCAQMEPQPAEVFVIAVPTPIREDKVPDISYVIAATRAIAPVLKQGNLVILIYLANRNDRTTIRTYRRFAT